MHREGRGNILLSCQQAGQIGSDLADLVIGAGNIDAIAVRGAGRSTNKMISLIGSYHEERIAGVNAIIIQASKELPKGRVIRLEGRYIASRTRTKGRAGRVSIVRIRDIRIGHWHSMLL